MIGHTFWSLTPSGYWLGWAVEPPTFATIVAPTAWLPMAREPAHVPVEWSPFRPGVVDRVGCSARRTVAATAVGPSVVP